MADQGSIANLKQNINENIYDNTDYDITGGRMNTILQNVVDTLEFNGRDFFNVNEYREKSDEYADAAAGRAAVPDEVKKNGLFITYLLADGWVYEQFVGSSIADWSVATNWKTFKVDASPSYNSDHLVSSGGIFNSQSDFNGCVFVKGQEQIANKFFKELHIVPVVPGSFNKDSIKRVAIYRQYAYTGYDRWYIGFFDNNGVALATFDVQVNPEATDIITLSDNGSSSQRFNAYAVVDWSVLASGERYIRIDCDVTDLCFDLKYCPYIHYKQVTLDLINNGYCYKGIAKHDTTVSPKTKEFYLCFDPGVYTNFNGLSLPFGCFGLLKYDTAWHIDIINLNIIIGNITAYNGIMSKTAAGANWETVRRFYDVQSSYGTKVHLNITNETGSGFVARFSYTDGTSEDINIGSTVTEYEVDKNLEIRRVFLYFASNATPEGNFVVTISCNNYYYIEKLNQLVNELPKNATQEVTSGGNIFVRILGDWKAGKSYIFRIDGNVDTSMILRGIKRSDGSTIDIKNVYCGQTIRITPSYDFKDIRVARNSVTQSGSVTLTYLPESFYSLILSEANIAIQNNGSFNRKKTVHSGFDARYEFVGNFKKDEVYSIEIKGAQSQDFILRAYTLDDVELYSSSGTFVVGRTYSFIMPVDADKISILRNGLIQDIDVTICVREQKGVRETRPFPNFTGIPIAAHQGAIRGGETIGSPNAWVSARNLGYKWVECDIQFSSDNIPIFLHDEPINKNGNYIVSKADGTPVNPLDNITVASLTAQQLKETYRWADGGEILTITEGFGLLTMLGMNCVLEFKAIPNNTAKRENLKTACLLFGIERIIYNATSTPYNVIFPILINLGIYRRGAVSLTSSNESDVEEAFAYAQQIGNTCVNAYGISGGINTVFIQQMMEKYGVQYEGKWADSNSKHQTCLIVSNDIAPVLDQYSNMESLVTNQDVAYSDFTTVGTINIDSEKNVNLCMIADGNIELSFSGVSINLSGNVNVAFVVGSYTYTISIKGTGHVTKLFVRY